MVDNFFRLTFSVMLWGGRNTANKYHGMCGDCSQCLGHTGFVPACGMCPFPVYTAQALVCSAGNCLRRALGCICFPGRSGDQVFGKHSRSYLSPLPSLLLGFLGVQLVHLLRQMLTIKNPKKSWLAMKTSCSLVDNASLGPLLPTSGSGCPCLPISGGECARLQPSSSAQSFVL